jgi:hypothetical protein
MSCEFEAVDYRGVLVICIHDRWEGHIVSGHEYMEGQQAAVITALSDPYYVYRSAGRSNRRLYYRPLVLPRPYTQDFLLVVADYPTGRRRPGRIVTAYRRQTFRRGDIWIWSKLGAAV